MKQQQSSRKTLQAVLDEDLRDLLKSIGQLEAFEAGRNFCGVCGTLLTMKNLQMIIPGEHGAFTFVCDRPDCVASSDQRI